MPFPTVALVGFALKIPEELQPFTARFRLPLPMYGPMTAVAGQVVRTMATRSFVAWRRAEWLRPERSPAYLMTALLAALGLSAVQVLRSQDVEARIFGLGGDAGPAARAVATSEMAWQADRIYFSGQDGRSRWSGCSTWWASLTCCSPCTKGR